MTPEISLVKVNSPMDARTFEALLSCVQPIRREQILRQGVQAKREVMLAGDILAMHLIQKVFDIPAKEQVVSYTEQGKPYLQNHSRVHYSISHSDQWVACAVFDSPVGLDIQTIGTFNDGVAKRVCNEAELLQLAQSKDAASLFTKLWTQKEAVVKKSGAGIFRGNIKHCLEGQHVESEQMDGYWLSIAY